MKPVDAEKGLSKVGGHEVKTREGSPIPTLESMAIRPMSPREFQEKEVGAEGSIRSIGENDGGQASQSDRKGVP